MEHPFIYWAVTGIVVVIAFAIAAFNSKHWIGQGRYLCHDCKFNTPQDCLKPERPTALDCTAYSPKRPNGEELPTASAVVGFSDESVPPSTVVGSGDEGIPPT